MMRMLPLWCAMALAIGCRTPESNPFAAIGPATIPPPTIEVPGQGGYYSSPPAGTPGSTVSPPANALPSISVPTGSPPAPQPSIPRPYSFGSLAPSSSRTATTSPSFTTDPADREPIRVLEAAPSTMRTATAPRAAAPSVLEAAPAAREPIRAFNTNPATTSPPAPLLAPPPSGGFRSSGSFPIGSGVQPAAYQPPAYVPAFVERSAAGEGQWKSR